VYLPNVRHEAQDLVKAATSTRDLCRD